MSGSLFDEAQRGIPAIRKPGDICSPGNDTLLLNLPALANLPALHRFDRNEPTLLIPKNLGAVPIQGRKEGGDKAYALV